MATTFIPTSTGGPAGTAPQYGFQPPPLHVPATGLPSNWGTGGTVQPISPFGSGPGNSGMSTGQAVGSGMNTGVSRIPFMSPGMYGGVQRQARQWATPPGGGGQSPLAMQMSALAGQYGNQAGIGAGRMAHQYGAQFQNQLDQANTQVSGQLQDMLARQFAWDRQNALRQYGTNAGTLGSLLNLFG